MLKLLTVWMTTNWTFMKKWDYLTCLLRNLNTGQEATVRTERGTMDWVQIWERV